MKLNPNHIFIDTNVLNGFYLNKTADMECLQYLFSLKGKKLFISSLSIGQFVAFFQKKLTNEKIKDIIRYFFTKFTIIEFNDKHFTTFLNINALKSSEVRSMKK